MFLCVILIGFFFLSRCIVPLGNTLHVCMCLLEDRTHSNLIESYKANIKFIRTSQHSLTSSSKKPNFFFSFFRLFVCSLTSIRSLTRSARGIVFFSLSRLYVHRASVMFAIIIDLQFRTKYAKKNSR